MQISWSAFRSLPLFASPLSPPVVGDVPPAVDTFTPGASPPAAAAAPKRLDVDVGALLDNIRDFTEALPESATEAKAAIGHLLEEGSRMAARNPSYVPMAIIATSARIDRARKAEDLSAALEGEHLNVPLGNFGVVSEGRLYRGAQPTHEAPIDVVLPAPQGAAGSDRQGAPQGQSLDGRRALPKRGRSR